MNNKFKFGFSLFEAFVVMLIVGLFVALMANTVAHRPKKKIASEAHGRFECYYDNGVLYQQMFTEKSSTGRTKATKTFADTGASVKYCEFTPPSYAKYLIIDAVGGGAGGSGAGGAEAGQFVSTFYATVERKYYILPGKGGKKETSTSAAGNGTESVVYSIDKDGNKNSIIVAAGGKAVSSLENTTVNDVLACSISEWCTQEEYDCHITPSCEVVNGRIEVSFCRSKGTFVTVPIDYKKVEDDGTVEKGNPRYIVNDVYTEQKNANTWVYHDISQWSDYNETDLDPTKSYRDIREAGWKPSVDDPYVPSMYTMELLMDTTADGTGYDESNLHRIIESLQYTSKMADAHVGRGGAKNKAGDAGGVLFLW